MKTLSISLFVVALLGVLYPLQAQRFGAGLVLGVNAAQVDGDDQLGYKRWGFSGGLRGMAHLGSRFDLVIELLYSQKGSSGSGLNIDLNYAEVPILIAFKMAQNWDKRYTLQLQAGVSYSRLLNYSVEDTRQNSIVGLPKLSIEQLAPDFNRNDIGIVVGFHWFPWKNVGVGLRHTYSVTPFYDAEDTPDPYRNGSLRNFFFTLQALFVI